MNLRRLSLAAVFVVAVAVTAVLAQPPVTVVLTNGQQYDGSLVGGNNGNIVLDVNGRQRTFSHSQIGVIEFNGQQPTSQELQRVSSVAGNNSSFLRNVLSSRNSVLVLQDGQMLSGVLSSISDDGSQITLTTQNGQNNYDASDIARLYPNPSNAQNLQNVIASNQNNQDQNNPNQYYGYGSPVGTSGQMTGAKTITVPANQPWTPTGIQVRQGERVTFQASGQIRYAPEANSTVGPNGGPARRDISEQFPLPTVPVGALIARVGNSQPFLIGDFTQPLTMPESGQLYLGINDSIYGDNTGNFTVQVNPAGGR